MLEVAETRLRKAIISNCKKEFANCTNECFLNVLNRNIKLTICNTRKLQKHKAALRKVADRHVSLSGNKNLIVQHGGFLLPLLNAVLPIIANLVLLSK